VRRTVPPVISEQKSKSAIASASKSDRIHLWHEKFVVERRYLPASARRSLYVWACVLIVVGLVFFAVILADVLNHNDLSRIDAPIDHWLDGHRAPALTVATVIVATVFGPIALPIIVLVVTVTWAIVAKHIWRPLLLAAGTITGVIVVQVITRLVNRHRPPSAFMLIGIDKTASFPSGHVLGACDFLLILTYLVVSRRGNSRAAVGMFSAAAVVIFATAFSRVYLGYHWPTDALGSISLSLIVLGAVIAVDTRRTVRVRPIDEMSGPAPS
jgi:membrane-associated phospholipid phosphatase